MRHRGFFKSEIENVGTKSRAARPSAGRQDLQSGGWEVVRLGSLNNQISSTRDASALDPDTGFFVLEINFAYSFLLLLLDVSNPLHLHPNDFATLTVVYAKLKGNANYQVWSCAMLLTLEGKNKIGFIDGSCRRSNTDEILGRQWDRVNVVVLGWILNSISKELFLGQIFSKRAKHIWEELKETYDKVDGFVTFSLHHKIHTLSQNRSSIVDYYHRLNATWKQFDALIELPRCTCHAVDNFKKHNQLIKLMQFLMGLDDTYMQIRSFILSRETLPDVRSAYAIISSEESYRVASGSISKTSQRSQTSAYTADVSNRGNYQRSHTSNSFLRPSNTTRPTDNGNGRSDGGPTLVCEKCGFNGQTIDMCFKFIGYPANLGKKKAGKNFKGKNVSNNVVGSGSSTGFSDEQLSTLISLIKENSVNGKDSGENQHITFTDKFLVNVIDISHLKIKVSHPNGTEAFITKIRNIPITDYLTLFDVLVVPEYYVSLMSVHKDTWHCRLGYPTDQVLNVLKPNLLFENYKSDVVCDVCQRAKQTREPFLLSDHISIEIGELVHLDFLGHIRSLVEMVSDIFLQLWMIFLGLFGSNNGAGFVNHRDVKFFKDIFPFKQKIDTPSELSIPDLNHLNLFNFDYLDDHPDIPNDDEKSDPVPNRHSHGSNAAASEDESIEPKSFLKASKHQPWVDTMNSKMDALYRNNTWELADIPKGRKAIGFNQRERIDFDETFSPVIKIVIVSCLINLVVQNDWTLYQIDVNNAFLYGDLNESVYMSLPPGYFPANKTRVCKLNNKSDYSLFTKSCGDVFIAFLVYVDDIIITGNSLTEINKNSKWYLFESKEYCLQLIDEFGLLASKPSHIPMHPNISLSGESKDDDPLLDNVIEYQNPLKSHLKTALKVIRYLKGSPGKGINVIKSFASGIDLKAYTDADWARCIDTRRIRLREGLKDCLAGVSMQPKVEGLKLPSDDSSCL
ncbi:ribonuclease H-like domain-containing protein [Tanacetum coccineum]